jgi:hypothetical protein
MEMGERGEREEDGNGRKRGKERKREMGERGEREEDGNGRKRGSGGGKR